MNLMEKYRSKMKASEKPDRPLSPHETGLSIQTEAVYCSWLQKDVPKNECFKPLSCFHRDENNKPKECQHLKAFIRQRNKELGL